MRTLHERYEWYADHQEWIESQGKKGVRAYMIDAGLRGANLRGANLIRAYMVDVDLRGADLRGANLRGAALSGANLRDANLRDANLRGARLDHVKGLIYAQAATSDHDGGYLLTVWHHAGRTLCSCGCLQCDVTDSDYEFMDHLLYKDSKDVCIAVYRFCKSQVDRSLKGQS